MARKPSAYPFPTAGAERIKLDADTIAGFVELFLQPHFDRSKPTPAFHKKVWEWDCSDHELGVGVAPRGHAKTTGCTIACALADVLFGAEDFEILIGANEKKAAQFLSNIDYILTDPRYCDLHDAFECEILKSNETELVGRVKGREFCIMARGKGQKVRGELWRQMRPGKIRVDDLENDEDVENDDTRRKDMKWLMDAVIPALADGGKMRVLGTILHEDSVLNRLMLDSQLNLPALTALGLEPQWNGIFFAAHKSFNDFSDILWPEKFDEKRLRAIRQRYINQRNANGYSKEYLGIAIAEGNEFFDKECFIEMVEQDFRRNMTIYGSIDFAVSEKKDTDNTCFTLAGFDCENMLNVLEVKAEIMNTLDAAKRWFELDALYNPAYWIVESENIAKSIGPFVDLMMIERNHFLSVKLVSPKHDKKMRARSIQARHAARGVRYNKQMPGGFEELEQEMTKFPRGAHDDRVDTLGHLGMELATMVPANTEEEDANQEYAEMVAQTGSTGRSATTGY